MLRHYFKSEKTLKHRKSGKENKGGWGVGGGGGKSICSLHKETVGYISLSKLRSCVKVEAAVLGSPS